jgi:predicted CopG family antitoxin
MKTVQLSDDVHKQLNFLKIHHDLKTIEDVVVMLLSKKKIKDVILG